MNEESQVRGCYNITFICTNQETVRLSPDTAGTLGERGRGGPSAQVLRL